MRYSTRKDADGWYVIDHRNGNVVARKGRNTCKAVARSLNKKEAALSNKVCRIKCEIRKGRDITEIKAKRLASWLGCKRLKKRDNDLTELPLALAKSHHEWRKIHKAKGGCSAPMRAQLVTLQQLLVRPSENGIVNFLTSDK